MSFHRFIVFSDLQNLLGNSRERAEIEAVWRDSLAQCNTSEKLSFADFKYIMKGQGTDIRGSMRNSALATQLSRAKGPGGSLGRLPENFQVSDGSLSNLFLEPTPPLERASADKVFGNASTSQIAYFGAGEAEDDEEVTPIVANRALYRKHREMRLAVLEASKEFDKRHHEKTGAAYHAHLTMKRDDSSSSDRGQDDSIYGIAAKRYGLRTNKKTKTKSDLTGMFAKPMN